MSAAPFVELRNINKYFAKVIANQDVSLQIRKGEVLALLGENGAGKSTIMKVLYGLYKADAGQILIDGARKSHPFAQRRHAIGHCHDPAAFCPGSGVTR